MDNQISNAEIKIHEHLEINQGGVTTFVDVNEHFDLFQIVIGRTDNDGKTQFNKQEFFMTEDQMTELTEFFSEVSSKLYRKNSALRIEEFREQLLEQRAAQKDFVDDDTSHVNLSVPSLFRDIMDTAFIKTKCLHSKDYCKRFYATLCNNGLAKGTYETGYSWRGAGGLIADILGVGNYMDWYCSGNEGYIDDEVEEDLKAIGWAVLGDYYDIQSYKPDTQLKLGENDEK